MAAVQATAQQGAKREGSRTPRRQSGGEAVAGSLGFPPREACQDLRGLEGQCCRGGTGHSKGGEQGGPQQGHQGYVAFGEATDVSFRVTPRRPLGALPMELGTTIACKVWSKMTFSRPGLRSSLEPAAQSHQDGVRIFSKVPGSAF